MLVEAVTTASYFFPEPAVRVSLPLALWVVPQDRNEALMVGLRLVGCLDAHLWPMLLFFGQSGLTRLG